MTTPNQKEIEEKAKRLYFESGNGVFETNPTTEELRESGYVHGGKNDLMRSEGHEFLSYLEEQATSLGFELRKVNPSELEKQTKPYDFEVDINELLRSGCFVCGGKGSGKSNLCKIIADRLLKCGYIVKVYDISRTWLESSIPYVVQVETNTSIRVNLYDSVVYDLSKLKPNATKKFIAENIGLTWNLQVNKEENNRKPIVFVLEECQLLVPLGHLRSNEAQEILRLMSTGRNYDLGFIAVSQRPTLVDPTVFELAHVRYFGRLDGYNDLKRVSSYIGVERARQLQKLEIGHFILDMGDVTKLITTEEFKPRCTPQRLATFATQPKAATDKQPSLLDQAIGLTQIGAIAIFVLAIVSAISHW